MGFLDCWIWVKLVNGVREIMKWFVCKWCECMEVVGMKILWKDNVVEGYGVIVVVRERMRENGKVWEVEGVWGFVVDCGEEERRCVEVVGGMVVVMEEEGGLIVYMEVFVLLMLVCMGVEEGNMFERVGINVSSWFDKW